MIYPFNSKRFLEMWELWKEYKKLEFRFQYKSEISEQMGLKIFFKDMTENEAIEAIEWSIAKGYRGVFKNPNFKQNGTTKDGTAETVSILAARHGISNN